jgi:hypothetical protein
VINLEKGMPPLETALAELSSELRRQGRRLFLCQDHPRLRFRRQRRRDPGRRAEGAFRLPRSGRIRAFVPGEDFSAFSAETREMEDACPEIAHDSDFARQNHGVTVVLL